MLPSNDSDINQFCHLQYYLVKIRWYILTYHVYLRFACSINQ
jgi:hypothetical protein